ncbi:ATP-binding protein [Bacillota bacterium LCP21S3_D9]
MTTGDALLLDIEAQMQDIGLPLMARKLDQIYRSPDYLTRDKLSLISDILAPEYQDKTSKRLNNRMKTAKLIGTPCDIRKCTDSSTRQYTPAGSPRILSSLKFIEDGLNVCILGASDSGKTYLAKAIGVAACEKYRVSYNRCDEFLSGLVTLKQRDYAKYERSINKYSDMVAEDVDWEVVCHDVETYGCYKYGFLFMIQLLREGVYHGSHADKLYRKGQ